jgi:hypothetical protein
MGIFLAGVVKVEVSRSVNTKQKRNTDWYRWQTIAAGATPLVIDVVAAVTLACSIGMLPAGAAVHALATAIKPFRC